MRDFLTWPLVLLAESAAASTYAAPWPTAENYAAWALTDATILQQIRLWSLVHTVVPMMSWAYFARPRRRAA